MGVVLDGSINTLAARFRIESPKDDAFQSGNTVLGNATFQACSAGCKDFYVRLPFEFHDGPVFDRAKSAGSPPTSIRLSATLCEASAECRST
jgi:hypothetical protein